MSVDNAKLNQLIACHDCDLLIEIPEKLENFQHLACPRCGETQFSVQKSPIDKTLALSLSALMFLIISVSFPFMTISSKGVVNTISLLQAPNVLLEDGYSFMAFIVIACVIVLPGMYLICLVAMLAPLLKEQSSKASMLCAKIISTLVPWMMADVFVLGVLVALIKLMHMVDILLGVAFWSYIGFTVLLLNLSSIVTKRQLWYWVTNGR
ncbi:paraquat-inducible protein A [Glaciecola siphonariae]|uniref:Paraquat-inducible protein A n=1 Tax=Glaciecola siphonariae TaxID=521012 RepID=A0ABV9M210_9ALTE